MLRCALLAVLALAATGCGGTATGGGGDGGDALSYLPANAATVVFISTDVDGEQWEAFDEQVFRKLDEENQEDPQTVEQAAEDAAKEAGLSWEDDVKPLLGNDIVVGIEGNAMSLLGAEGETTITAALDLSGGDIEEVLEKAKLEQAGEANGATLYREPDGDDVLLAVEDGVLIGAQDEEALRRALVRRDNGDGLAAETADEAFTNLPEEALVRAFGTLDDLRAQDELSRFADLPLVQALETWGLTVAFQRDHLNVDLAVGLDETKLDEADLPLVTGEGSPEIVIREGEVSGGNRNQSQTTAFLLRALRVGYPNSRFVKAADAIEKELGLDFEQEILRQFDGPSASYVSPDGKIFAARSEVSDPEALKAVLPRIAPHLPALVEGLQGLESEGMALLFLFAPDAPAAAPMEGVEVEKPATDDGLYRISGLTGDGPSQLYLGLVGDVFVVASDERRARDMAEADTSPARDAEGAGVLRADLTRLGEQLDDFFLPIDGKELVASLEASTKELRARVRIELD